MDKGVTSTSLSRFHSGDDKGLDALIKRHLAWIHNHVHRRLGSLLRKKGDTTDYVQDAIVQFLKYGPRFMISKDDDFRGLMVCIVENTLRDKRDWYTARRREIARERPLGSDTVLYLDPPKGSVKTPSKSADAHEREAWIRMGMELMDPKERGLIILRQWDKKSFVEIGKILEIDSDAARMRYNRAVGRLSEKVGYLRRRNLSAAIGKQSA